MPDTPAIDRVELQNLASLARLDLPAERQAILLHRLQRIVAAFDALRELPTGPAPAGLPSLPPLGLRPDVAEPAMPVAEVLANTRHQAAGAFVVPRVVDG
ncbi:MAG TPA: aspartyl/glutamyl-tRNA amidotransferase subunit C [Planctomycetota bacterium]